MDPKTLRQCFFHGHTENVVAFAFSGRPCEQVLGVLNHGHAEMGNA